MPLDGFDTGSDQLDLTPDLPPLTEEQEEALGNIVEAIERDQPSYVINGLAGTGKSTLLAHVAALYPDAPACSYTGKAASVLRGKLLSGRAYTIHGLIYYCQGRGEDGELQWTDRPFSNRIALLDEHSNVAQGLADDLMAKVTTLVAFGRSRPVAAG